MSLMGLLVIVVTALTYLVLVFAFSRTAPTVVFDAGVSIGFGLVVFDAVVTGELAPGFALAASVLAGAWFLLTRRELGLGDAPLAIGVGDAMPQFTVFTMDGAPFTDRDLLAVAPAALVLYRGWWCPYCSTQLKELAGAHDRLQAAGVTSFAVSVDPPEQTAGLRTRLGESVAFLSDPHGSLLDAVGVRDRSGAAWYDRLIYGAGRGDISLPAVIVVDRAGTIALAYRSPRIDLRARPEDILASLPNEGGRP